MANFHCCYIGLVNLFFGIVKPQWLAAPYFLIIIYVVTDEVHQIYVPGRMAAFAGVIVDMACTLLALSLSKRKHTLTCLNRL